MKYRSTRGGVRGVSFKQAVMMGLATDGGLLLPETIPDVSDKLTQWRGMSFQSLAASVMAEFIDDIPADDLRALIDDSYSQFDAENVVPVVPVDDFFVLELFHGPTLAFKDIALQFLGNVFAYILEQKNGSLNIIGATSGDTGSAAIAGIRGKKNIKIFIMFPEGKTSPVQEKQMTTVLDDNVFNIAVDGSFDDCQALLKEVFSDIEFKQDYQLGAVNSVNWARVLAQIVYYFHAWYQLKEPEQFDVAVPTGNFGDIFAGFLARKMGLPIGQLILATNSNDILARFFETGHYQRGEVHYSESPAMDIQVSSNFERYLYYLLGEDPDKVKSFMAQFAQTGQASVDSLLDDCFVSGAVSDQQTLATIRELYEQTGYLLDPHTAVGVTVGKWRRSTEVPLLCLSTAHPAKFDGAMRKALPDVCVEHPTLTALQGLPTRKQNLAADVELIRSFIHQRASS